MASRYNIPEDQLSLFTGFEVKINIFEGPLDLLLHLVRRSQVNIAEVNVTEITTAYISYIQAMESLNVDLAAEFIVVATQLIYLKSRSLLPMPEDAEEEEDDLELDPQVALARRLEEYRVYREAAGILDTVRQERQRIFLRSTNEDEFSSGYVELEDVSIFDMVAAVSDMLKRAAPSPPRIVHRREVTVAQRIPEIITELYASGSEGIMFTGLVEFPATRVYIVVTFLSVLELIRRGRIRVGTVEGGTNFRIWAIVKSERQPQP